jgi:hypothetical protein
VFVVYVIVIFLIYINLRCGISLNSGNLSEKSYGLPSDSLKYLSNALCPVISHAFLPLSFFRIW